ncbi:prolyl oligopeptidase family serine peptidase [Rhizorhapis suberifaciens]|uniref:prolyl oligopeptidase n=1 Tax=Rhizorhapis suberifaciens TaxID=13656 RepID=A0A840HW95_9SPHN|nr:prolyl oligopeptidase family serine peptidase [Rhizorhapis suberifaciens]MBB4641850.1 prolyl oligopeptidase [Rhizorhapis suberifaciens]
MKKSALALPLAAIALVPVTGAADTVIGAGSRSRAPMAYPQTMRQDLVEEHFGVKVADPYRWLEKDVRQDSAVLNWVNAQNEVTNAYLETVPGRDILKKRIKSLMDHDRYGTPRKAGRRYFYTYNSGLQNQSPLYVREALTAKQRLLIDPNTFSTDGTTALAEWEPSFDGRYLLYAIQDGGSDWRTLHVLDVTTGKVLPDEIRWVKFSDLAWDREGRGFFYSRFAVPREGEAFQSTNLNQQVFYHRLGTPQSADELIYATPGRPKLGHSAQVSDDGRWLLISSAQGTDERYELTIADLHDQTRKPWPLVKGLNHDWRLIGNLGPKLYFLTNKGAPRLRLVTLDATHPSAPPVEVVAERKETLVGGSMVGDKIILAYLSNARTVAEMVNLSGRPAGDVPMPGIGTAAGFGGKGGDPETFFAFSGFTTPTTIYRFDTATGETSIFAQPKVDFDPSDYVTQQVFYPSKDGTRIPMFLIRRADVMQSGKPAPTLLYGYGGFNISLTPGFSAPRLAWLEQGGAVAIANLRGGGEFGSAWHDAGRLHNKQNVFDDFIAAGEFLIAQKITGKDQLAIEGRSNGGLLVGAVLNQRPDLFAAALPAVGVMDMLRFDRFTAGRYWVDDYGYPSRKKDFRTLLRYSPYHNIRQGTPYPAIMVVTADTDDRVVPGHSFKYVSALQHASIGEKPHLIRIETRAGHGSGKPTDKLIEEYSDMYAFIAKWTGLKISLPLQ